MIRSWDTTRRCAGRPVLRVWLAPRGNGDDDSGCVAPSPGRAKGSYFVSRLVSGMLCNVCLLLKVLLVLHCKLSLYYVQQSGAVSQRSVLASLVTCQHASIFEFKDFK